MSTAEDGGPAFPTEPNTQPGVYVHHGMSLRDWFAGQVLVGFVARGALKAIHARHSEKEAPSILAAGAYEIADAMLKAREQ